MKLSFISGLPRSGSTLLAAILSQNPEIRASMSSPLAGIVINLLNTMSAKNEFSVFLDDAKRKRIIQGLFDSYYQDEGRELVFDTSRAWAAKLPLLAALYPESRVICCVRSLGWISDSFEQMVQRNPFQPSGMWGFQAAGSASARLEQLHSPRGVIGASLSNLREGFYGSHSEMMILVRYSSLVNTPHETLERIYTALSLPSFEHDFENVTFDDGGFDAAIGSPGLHKIRRKVAPRPRDPLIGPDLLKKFSGGEFWLDEARNTKGVLII